MEHRIIGSFISEALLSVMEERAEINHLINQVISHEGVTKQPMTALKIINIDIGASPEIQNLIIKHITFNRVKLAGTFSMVYDLNLYWGCSLSSTQSKVETIWDFTIQPSNSTVIFNTTADSGRSTHDEF